MKNTFAILAATAAVGMASSAYSAEESTKDKSSMEYKKNGGYDSKRTTEHTTEGGTTHSSETKVDVDIDSKGNVDKVIKTESATDPKGLMNKKDDTSETKIEEKSRGGYKQTTTRKHTDAEGTNTTYKTVTDVDVDGSGNVTSTATTEKTVDPKGLMNETTTKNKTKAVNGRVVEKTTKSN
jgi:hypothetical protein